MYLELVSNGKAVGGDKYFDELNYQHLGNLMPKNKGRYYYLNLYRDILSNMGNKRFSGIVKRYDLTPKNIKNRLGKAFQPIANKILKDIDRAKEEDYISVQNAENLKLALSQLNYCCKIWGFNKYLQKITRLSMYAQFVSLKTNDVKRFQRNLKKLGFDVDISGVYDKKTIVAWAKFVKRLSVDQFVMLSNTAISGLSVSIELTDTMRVAEKEKKLFSQLGLTKLADNLNDSPKVVSIGRRTVIVSSLVFDTIEIGLALEKDFNKYNRVGARTIGTGIKILVNWVVVLGSKPVLALFITDPVVGAVVLFFTVIGVTLATDEISDHVIEWIENS